MRHKSILITLFIIFEFLKLSQCAEPNDILVVVFPGGKSHNFVLKKLFDYGDDADVHRYHILVHDWDKKSWPKNSEKYLVYPFGDSESYDRIFNDALELVRKNPVFGYSKFNEAMIHINKEFISSNHLETFRNINFKAIITDVPNYISKFLYNELNIPISLYVHPPSMPNLFYGMLEINPAYVPSIGAKFTDVMSFRERFLNMIFVNGMGSFFYYCQCDQVTPFTERGYKLDAEVFIRKSLIMIQYPYGILFNFPAPPNLVRLNAITPRPAVPLSSDNSALEEFLNRYEKNVYLSQGTIVHIVDFKTIFDIFAQLKDVGFVLSFKKALIPKELDGKFPENVLLLEWAPQNDVLGHPRVKAFITHGGTNSVSESIFHEKPMIALGVTLDQLNTAAAVKKSGVGIVIHEQSEITTERMVKALHIILEEDNTYTRKCKKFAKIMRANPNAGEVFKYWLNYGIENGYDHLFIQAYEEYYFWELHNYDIGLVLFLSSLFFFYISKKILTWVFCSCKTERKLKYY